MPREFSIRASARASVIFSSLMIVLRYISSVWNRFRRRKPTMSEPQPQPHEVEMIYNKASARISYSPQATYEDIIKIALERFGVPLEYSRFIQISFQNRYTFDKITFEYYLRLFPSPQITFEIDVDYVALLDGLHDSMLSESEPVQPTASHKRNHSRGGSRRRRHNYFKKPRVPNAAAT